MTSNERVMATFAHAPTDRVPLDYSANPGIEGRLMAYFGLSDDREELLQRLHIDFRNTGAPYVGPPLFTAPSADKRVDPQFGFVMRWMAHQDGGYWDVCDPPLQHATDDELDAWPTPNPDHYDYQAAVETAKRHAGYAISVSTGPEVINRSGRVRSMEEVLVNLATDHEAGLRFIDKRLDWEWEVAARTLEACKKGGTPVDFLFMGQDMGTQRGPFVSIDLFRKHIKPRLARYSQLAQAFDIPVMLHSCGSCSWAFEDLMEIGIYAIDTMQPEAADMEPAYIKERFGKKMSFHGCISTAGPLAYGTTQDVVNDVRQTLRVMMPGGGYFLAPTHMIQDNTPVDNVIAMYDTALREGNYT